MKVFLQYAFEAGKEANYIRPFDVFTRIIHVPPFDLRREMKSASGDLNKQVVNG